MEDLTRLHVGGNINDQSLEQRNIIKDPPKARAPAAPKTSLSSLTDAHNRTTTSKYHGFVSSFERHKKYMHDLVHYYGGKAPKAPEGENDFVVLQKNYQFIRDEFEDLQKLEEGNEIEKYEAKISLAYYQKLHKEYALTDLSRFETGKIGLMWRTDQQVISGKGQFICGAIDCEISKNLKEMELDFAYKENHVEKNELVKVALCELCAYKLNYKRIKDKEKKLRKEEKKEKKKLKKRKREKTKERKSKKHKSVHE